MGGLVGVLLVSVFASPAFGGNQEGLDIGAQASALLLSGRDSGQGIVADQLVEAVCLFGPLGEIPLRRTLRVVAPRGHDGLGGYDEPWARDDSFFDGVLQSHIGVAGSFGAQVAHGGNARHQRGPGRRAGRVGVGVPKQDALGRETIDVRRAYRGVTVRTTVVPVHVIGDDPNGTNINDRCGSTHPQAMQEEVVRRGADLGIALDGDGDRVVLVDETGRLVDGDQILYVLATAWQEEGRLHGPVVGTVMSNLGLERALQQRNIEFQRVAVGDRYVLEALKQGGGVIGGETSGHMIILDQTTTGDGLITALQVLAVMKRTGRTLSELVAGMPKYPQIMLNVRTEQRLDPDASPQIRNALGAARDELADSGRIVLRASGTEPVIRVMVEGQDEAQINSVAERLAGVVADAARQEVPKTAQKA